MPASRRAAGLVALAAALAGCNATPELSEVEGVITFKNAPVAEGTVTFMDNAGHVADARLGAGGRYVVTAEGRLPPGDYVITVTPATYRDDTDKRSPPVVEEKKAPNIPEKYRRQGSTPLKMNLRPGKNVLNLDMTP